MLQALSRPLIRILGCIVGCILTAASVVSSASAVASSPSEDLLQVETVASTYLDASRTGDRELFRNAFHPSTRLQFAKHDVYTEWSGVDYISWQKPRNSESTTRILFVDVAGSAAMVKVEIVTEGYRFVDYLSLLKVEGRWWIVNKVFHKQDRAAGGER